MNSEDFTYKNIDIRLRQDNLVSLSDLWKADGKARMKRPDEWIKQPSTQEELSTVAIGTGATTNVSANGLILYIAGVLETVRGGKPGSQGTFGDKEIAIAYARFLSDECGDWLYKKLLQASILENLPIEIIFSLIQSDKEFPIDFDDAWGWIGYKYKKNAKESLINNFELGVDYINEEFLPQKVKTKIIGRSSEKFYITVDCFKSFCLMAGTNRGKQVRKYFINCEKTLREILTKKEERWRTYGIELLVSEEYTAWKKRFEDDFFEEAYRVMGWKRPRSGHAPCMGWFINTVVYEHFPEGTLDRLQKVNPKVNGNRKRKHHQHLKDPGLRGLDYQKGAALATLRLSPADNPKRFMTNLKIALGQEIQLSLPFVDDETA